MAAYAYRAITAQGAELEGELHAPDMDAARENLRSRGLLPRTLGEVQARKGRGFTGARKKVKPKSLQILSRQFATLIEAGVSIVQSLVILERQTDDPVLADVVQDVREDVEGGTILSRAMSRHPGTFSELYVAMIQAGEASGTLDVVLDRLALQTEKETQIKRRVKSAMMYPSVVLIFSSLVLSGMLIFLVPIFAGIFKRLGGKLPLLTQIVVDASDGMRRYWYIVFPVLGATVWAIRRWKRSAAGRQQWDQIKLRLPLKIGGVVLKVTMARFARSLSTLVAAGVDIVSALEITATTVGNQVVTKALLVVREKVQQGVPIGQPLVENPLFPAMISQMITIGEETGELEKMLSKVADFYEDEVDAAVEGLTSLIEPIMMIGVGLMVGIIVIAMYLPMFRLLTLVK